MSAVKSKDSWRACLLGPLSLMMVSLTACENTAPTRADQYETSDAVSRSLHTAGEAADVGSRR
jgi:hypothetical protein